VTRTSRLGPSGPPQPARRPASTSVDVKNIDAEGCSGRKDDDGIRNLDLDTRRPGRRVCRAEQYGPRKASIGPSASEGRKTSACVFCDAVLPASSTVLDSERYKEEHKGTLFRGVPGCSGEQRGTHIFRCVPFVPHPVPLHRRCSLSHSFTIVTRSWRSHRTRKT
jgi:hypothetical protein